MTFDLVFLHIWLGIALYGFYQHVWGNAIEENYKSLNNSVFKIFLVGMSLESYKKYQQLLSWIVFPFMFIIYLLIMLSIFSDAEVIS